MRAINGRLMVGAFLACSMGWVIPAKAAVLTVDPQGSGFKTIQQALDAAASGDTVQLVDGTYSGEKNRGLRLSGNTITLCSVNGPANCIVDCGGYPLAGDPKGIVKGITIISDGQMAVSTDDLTIDNCVFKGRSQPDACALFIYQCRPTIVNCTFQDLSGGDGGAISCQGASPVIQECTFENNSARLDGGAIHNRERSGPVITGCRFVNNSCKDDGGAIANYDDSQPIILACTFERNRSDDNGAAIFSRSGSNPRIVSCIFAGNKARSHGGAIYNRENAVDVVNCVFTGNSAHNNGGALFYLQTDREASLLNCTLAGNTAGLQGGAVYCEDSRGLNLLNCIVWANRDETGDGQASHIFGVTPTLRHCCVQNWTGESGGPGNHSQDPQFADADGADNTVGTADDNLRLAASSPCIDTGLGTPLSDPFLTDCDGYPRFVGNATDMGAYEYALPDERSGMTPAHPQLDEDVIIINEVRSFRHYDWAELYNVTNRTIHIGGWLFSDRHAAGLYQIASGTVIEPHGYLVLYEDKHFGNRADPGCQAPFAFRREGDTLYLRSAYGGLPTGLRHEQELEFIMNDTALGRHVNSDGTVDFVRLSVPTPGAANASPWVGPVVISEIMCHRPADRLPWGYIEVCNTGDASLTLTGRTYTDSDSYHEWMSASVPAQSRILVSDDPAAMQTAYGPVLPSGVQILKGDVHVGEIGYGMLLKLEFGLLTFDRVCYRHEWVGGNPWPMKTDSSGRSVTRIDVTRYGNDPNNWQLAPPSPGK